MPQKSLDLLNKEELSLVREQEQPKWIPPMLATLTEDHFSHDSWIYERKLDGVRCMIYKEGGKVRLMSRNENLLNSIYPDLVINTDFPYDFIADGEIVAFDDHLTSFSILQNRMNVQSPSDELIKRNPVFLYLFDLIHFDGYDLTALPLLSRKKLLKKHLPFRDPWRFCSHRKEHGARYLDEACKDGWEGLIAKNAKSRYRHGRSKDWLKFKCVLQQEFVIGGYTAPKGEREGFGALLIGYYNKNGLQYAGKVGTGFNNKQLRDIYKKLRSEETEQSPFASQIREQGIRWTVPEMIAEIGFTEWTSSNKLRHPRFLGLRTDKTPKEVIKETPTV